MNINIDEHRRAKRYTGVWYNGFVGVEDVTAFNHPFITAAYRTSQWAYANVGNLNPGTADFTIEGWFYTDWRNYNSYSVHQDRCILCMQTNDSRDDFQWYVRHDNLKLYFNNGKVNMYGGQLALNQWYHIAVTRKDQVFYTFLNGEIIRKVTGYPSNHNASKQYMLGGAWNQYGHCSKIWWW